MRSPGIVLFGTKNLPNKTHAAGAKQVPSLSQHPSESMSPSTRGKKDLELEQALARERLAKANDATSFSQLTYLLQLITSINADEGLPPSALYKEAIKFNETDPNPQGFTVLDSIAAILVQNHEVVATCYTSDEVSVIVTELDAITPTDIETYDSSSGSPLDSNAIHPLQMAVLSNPEYPSSDSAKLDTGECNLHNVRIEPEGENLWTKVQGSSRGWYFAFM